MIDIIFVGLAYIIITLFLAALISVVIYILVAFLLEKFIFKTGK
jgi:phage shock protein PspC (stress-responsive transcriptional regulator)